LTVDTDKTAAPRLPLSKQRVLTGAIALADEAGIEGLTMRTLAESLSVEAMSLYYHVSNKEALLDGVDDAIIGELEDELGGFEVSKNSADWKADLRTMILTARKIMLRHKWAPGLFETRTTMSPRLLVYFDAVAGILREGGLSYDLIHRSMHALGSRALGFNQEMFVPENKQQAEADNEEMLELMASSLPYMTEMLMEIGHDDPDTGLGWCDGQSEFEFALDLTLDGIERMHRNA
jgi:AcrR family transcriptional regulator